MITNKEIRRPLYKKSSFDRSGKDFALYAGEPVKVLLQDDCFTVICSELGSYRIADKYKHSDRIWRGFSETHKSFVFTLELEGVTSGDLRFSGDYFPPTK